MTEPGRLRGRRVLITGASSGIGLEAARQFAAQGARLALLARGEEALEQAARSVAPDAVVVPADLSDRAAVERAVAVAVERLGGLDVVVSNAAAGAFGHLLEVDPDDFDRAVGITFGGAVNVIRASLPHLRASRGTIVATGSLLTRVPMPSWTSYVAAKHALRGFLNSLSIEEREQRSGVRIAMVHPGIVDTPFWSYATSATGRKPRVAPDAYAARVVAQALVRCAISPTPEKLVGGATLVTDRAYLLARGLVERALAGFDRWLHSGDRPAPTPGALWAPTGPPQVGAGIPARGSVAAARGVWPRLSSLLALARHLGTTVERAVALRRQLRRPLVERRDGTRRGRSAEPREPAST